MWIQILVVGTGGFLGANARYWLSINSPTPWGTFVANLLGSFGLAFFSIYISENVRVNEHIRLFVSTGFFGAFTTFSTFNYEALTLFYAGKAHLALLYLLGSIISGLAVGFLGIALARGIG